MLRSHFTKRAEHTEHVAQLPRAPNKINRPNLHNSIERIFIVAINKDTAIRTGTYISRFFNLLPKPDLHSSFPVSIYFIRPASVPPADSFPPTLYTRSRVLMVRAMKKKVRQKMSQI